MKAWLLKIFFGLVGIGALLIGYKRWGAATEKKKQAEKIAEDMKDDAEISRKPFVDSPFSRMRGKE